YRTQLPKWPSFVGFSGKPVKNPYQPKGKDMNRDYIASYNGPEDEFREVARWGRRFAPDMVEKVSGKDSVHEKDKEDSVEGGDDNNKLPKVWLTTRKKTPTPMLKRLAWEYYKRADFYLITDEGMEGAKLELDDVEFTGNLKERSEISNFLESRTPPAPPNPYVFASNKMTKFSKSGHATVLDSLPPPNNFYWLVAVVPSLNPDPSNPDQSSIDRQIKDFDSVSAGCDGVMKPGVYVDPSVDSPYLRIFTDVGGDGSKNKPRAFKSAVSAYETLVEDLPERVSPVVGDNQGMSLFLDRNVQVPGSDKLALLVFTQKSYPPAFLKNVALATEGVVEVGMITHPRDDLLESFQIRSLPNIVIVYDTPQDQRPEGAGEEGGVLLGQ
ncbi:hypothetical protein TrRE_jg6131, partial [Triparma retinervis]